MFTEQVVKQRMSSLVYRNRPATSPICALCGPAIWPSVWMARSIEGTALRHNPSFRSAEAVGHGYTFLTNNPSRARRLYTAPCRPWRSRRPRPTPHIHPSHHRVHPDPMASGPAAVRLGNREHVRRDRRRRISARPRRSGRTRRRRAGRLRFDPHLSPALSGRPGSPRPLVRTITDRVCPGRRRS